MAGDDVVGPERADGGGEQQRAVGAAAEGDQHRAELAQVAPRAAASRRSSTCSSSQAGNSARSSRTTWVPASSSSSRVQPPVSTETLMRAGGQRALDVVDVVADVDRGALAAEHVGLADAPDLALEVVDVEGEVVDVQLGVGRRTCR